LQKQGKISVSQKLTQRDLGSLGRLYKQFRNSHTAKCTHGEVQGARILIRKYLVIDYYEQTTKCNTTDELKIIDDEVAMNTSTESTQWRGARRDHEVGRDTH
jgi:hypothetical protein